MVSFNATKIITSGSGGALLTDNEEVAKYTALYRNNFMNFNNSNKHFWCEDLGTNSTPNNILSGLILEQIKELKKTLEHRKLINDTYFNQLKDLHLELVSNKLENSKKNNWYNVLRLPKNLSKETAIKRALEFKVELRPFFYNLTSQPFFKNDMYEKIINKYSNISTEYICLPSGFITKDDVKFVCEKLLDNF